jgi:hypothetical protein
MPSFVPILVGVVFLTSGLLMALGDPRRILRIDRKTGHAIYMKVIARGGSEEEAVAAAKQFYRVFGIVFVVIGIAIASIGLAMFLTGH